MPKVYRKSQQPESHQDQQQQKREEAAVPKPSDSFRLTDQYIALLILVFTKAGLLDVCLVACTLCSDTHT